MHLAISKAFKFIFLVFAAIKLYLAFILFDIFQMLLLKGVETNYNIYTHNSHSLICNASVVKHT